ncbi:MAG: serine protease [Candidatus Obscuribacterales bacterium]|nr:serine protease [Candidatus Obscuribacterales bacterium]
MHLTANIRQITLIIAACASSFFCQAAQMLPAYAQEKAESWETLDKRLKGRVFQLNVAVKFRLKNGFAHLTDLSPKYRYPVFGTSADDKGFRVVGSGSSFPIQTIRNDKRYFLTNRHVVTSGDNLIKECERFFAALRFYAQQTAGFGDPENRYRDLLNIVNLSQKKDMSLSEKVVYQSTVDGVWDTYENTLSVKADPSRVQFQKYLAQAGLVVETGFFLHPVGPVTQPSIPAQLFKVAKSDNDPDLALLSVNNLALPIFEFENIEPSEGQEIQVIGYPLASDQIDFDSGSYYTPTFSTGRISRVAPRFLQVDAPVSVGNSGGPVVSQRGKVLGVVVRRASFQQKLGTAVIQTELPNFAGAIAVQSIKSFAPELFNGQ